MTDKEKVIQEIKNLDDDKIKTLKKYLAKLNKKKTEIVIDRSNIDKTTPKYKLLLKYVNGILKNIGKDEIDDLTQFKEVDRLDIIKDVNLQLLDKMAPKLFKHFNKLKCGYYRNSVSKPLNVLRGMVKEMDMIFLKKQHNIIKNTIFKTHMLYSIK